MITYNDIYEALRKERYSEQLQPLAKNFISEVASYFHEKKEIASKQDDLFSDSIIKTKKQYENAIAIFKELFLRRKKKLLNLAFIAAETGISKRDFENMLPFERELFDKIMSGMEKAEKSLLEFLNEKAGEKKHKLVSFKEDVSEIMDLEGNPIGPFKAQTLANLPREIADILHKEGKIEYVDEE